MCACVRVRARERTGEELKLDWDLWEVICFFFLNHGGEQLMVFVVHPSGTSCLRIQNGPLNQMEESQQ